MVMHSTRIENENANVITDKERKRQLQIDKNQPAISVLQAWLEDDDEESVREQRETWEYLKRVLDEDRPSYRKLFP
jgi:DNA-directed RNA polymerase subunit F